ncbi:SAM-dependent methyltransferase [Haloprofundus marisrubri]|uniref:SAM-dependent methyltransferase n=1 Tax=Haloprofundus marisrubri TaxID=1514971 RepID=A0A0W1RAT3_9EURY|nr:SAM-dependent methyltransferase [Haloprofundus marisrubri]
MAEHFASTREYPWPEVKSFVADATDDEQATRALDLGCANGRHCELLSEHAASVVGLDVSRELLREARKRATERDFDVSLVHGDAARLPFCDETFDLAVYVATLHHLTSREARVDSLDELARVLRPGGRALVSAWSTEHSTFDETEGFDTTVDWTLPGGERVPRFYHIYDPAEFRVDLDSSELTPVDVFVSSGNCYAVVE